jgi:FSR family fosmidomycin resistance protein-like MFS transporter
LKVISYHLSVYGVAHALVDGLCAAVLFSLLNAQVFSLAVMTYLFLLYNLLAFGLQVIFGFIFDYFKTPRLAAVLGLLMVGISTLIFSPLPVLAIILLGIGNALFHIGGGIISLNLTPRKATAPGIFVAPGAIGLLVGTLLGKSGNFIAWTFLPAIAALVILIFLVPCPALHYEKSGPSEIRQFRFEYILYLVLFVIAIRSLVGFAIVFPWKTDVNWLVMLTLCVALGKGLGGFLADKVGWKLTAVGSLILSVPLLTLGTHIPVLGIVGMFLFNITMPVTLTLVSNLIPGKPGTAFGLTCAALLLGTLPAFSELQPRLNNLVIIDAIILVSALALYFSLSFYQKNQLAGPSKRINCSNRIPVEDCGRKNKSL